MTTKQRNRQAQHSLKKMLYERREAVELHGLREYLLLRSDDIKQQLTSAVLADVHKLQGKYEALNELLTVFDRAPLNDPSAE